MDASLAFQDPGALTFTAYFSGLMQISQSLATVSCPLLRKEGERQHRPWAEHPVFRILNSTSNTYVDSIRWRELNFSYAMNWGNAYSFIERDNFNRPKNVYLLDSGRMKVEVKDSGEPVYLYTLKKGGQRIFDYTEIFHFMGFGPSPYEGYSLIELHRQALSLGLQQQDFSNNFIKNGVHTSGVFRHPQKLSDEAHSHLNKSIKENHAGANNAGTFLILEEGMDFETMTMPLKDAEFLGSRVFQIQEIARILNIPPHKLKDLSRATFSNIEHQQIEYITDTLRPWAERFEKAVDTQLLTPIERKKGGARHMLEELQRGDLKTMIDAQRIGRFAGMFSPNDSLANLGMSATISEEDGGNRYLQASNMMNADSEAARNGGGDAGGTGNESEEMVSDTE
jgi:HK97 family phage portal protein